LRGDAVATYHRRRDQQVAYADWKRERRAAARRRRWKAETAETLEQEYRSYLAALLALHEVEKNLHDGADALIESEAIRYHALRRVVDWGYRVKTVSWNVTRLRQELEQDLLSLETLYWQALHDEGRTNMSWEAWSKLERERRPV
jgi:hypothetical protein